MSSKQVTAQLTNAKGWYDDISKIENRKIGWINMLKFLTPAKPYAKDRWSYSSKEVEVSQKLTGWLQQTYTPTGLLGEMKQSFLANKEAFGPDTKYFGANEAEKYNRKALPNTYGFYARLHQCLVKTAAREFWPMPGNFCYHNWYGMVNNVELISRQQIYLSGPDDYYCTQPRYSPGMTGEFGAEWREKAAHYRDFTKSPALQKFDHYLIPAKSISNDADTYVVILSRDNKPLPFEQVTVAQLVKRLEERLPAMEKIYYNNSGTTQNILEKMKNGIAVMNEQFKNNMNDPVYLYSSTTDISWIILLTNTITTTWIIIFLGRIKRQCPKGHRA
ncbi:hypothetical protein ACFPMF_10675 [Larkinella bovis]|uniref:Uncharacterized protein n=1 Tax=Larkinella bovis TaxID=683041 RepID=A0ABW0IA61_9BACT